MSHHFKQRVSEYFQQQIQAGNWRACLTGLEACIRTGHDLTVAPYETVIPFLVSKGQWRAVHNLQPQLLPRTLQMRPLNIDTHPSVALRRALSKARPVPLLPATVAQEDPLASSSLSSGKGKKPNKAINLMGFQGAVEKDRSESESSLRLLLDVLSKGDKATGTCNGLSLPVSSVRSEIGKIHEGPHSTQKPLFSSVSDTLHSEVGAVEESWRERLDAVILKQATKGKRKLRVRSSSITSSPSVGLVSQLGSRTTNAENANEEELKDELRGSRSSEKSVVAVLLEAAISAYTMTEGHEARSNSPYQGEPNSQFVQILRMQRSIVELVYCVAAHQLLLPEQTAQRSLEVVRQWLESMQQRDLSSPPRSNLESHDESREPLWWALQTAHDLLAAHAIVTDCMRSRDQSQSTFNANIDACTHQKESSRDGSQGLSAVACERDAQERLSRALQVAKGWDMAWALSNTTRLRDKARLTWDQYEHLLHVLSEEVAPARDGMRLEQSWQALRDWFHAMQCDHVVPANTALDACLKIILRSPGKAPVKGSGGNSHGAQDACERPSHGCVGAELERERILLQFAVLLTSLPPTTNARHKKNHLARKRGEVGAEEKGKSGLSHGNCISENIPHDEHPRHYTLSTTLVSAVLDAARNIIDVAKQDPGGNSLRMETYQQLVEFTTWLCRWSRPPRLSPKTLDACVAVACWIDTNNDSTPPSLFERSENGKAGFSSVTRLSSSISQELYNTILAKGEANENFGDGTKLTAAAGLSVCCSFSNTDWQDRYGRCFSSLHRGSKAALRLIAKQLSLHDVCCSTDSLIELFGCAAAAMAWKATQHGKNAERDYWLPIRDHELWPLMVKIITSLHTTRASELAPGTRATLALTVAEQSLWAAYPQLLFSSATSTGKLPRPASLSASASPMARPKWRHFHEAVPNTGGSPYLVDRPAHHLLTQRALQVRVIRYLEKTYTIALEHFLPEQTALWGDLISSAEEHEGTVKAPGRTSDFCRRIELLRAILLDSVPSGKVSRSAVDLQWTFRCLVLDELKLRLQHKKEARLQASQRREAIRASAAEVEGSVDENVWWWCLLPWFKVCMTSERNSLAAFADRSFDKYATGEALACLSEKAYTQADFEKDRDKFYSLNVSCFTESEVLANALARSIVVDSFVLYRLWHHVLHASKGTVDSNSNTVESAESVLSAAERHEKVLDGIVRRTLIQRFIATSNRKSSVGLLTHTILLQCIEEV